MKITVLIPTYRRTEDLEKCLEYLKKQSRLPDEIVVIVRDSDQETWDFLDLFDRETLPLSPIPVSIPGQVAALNIGVSAAMGDIIAITDDDAAPHVDWLERIESHFVSDERLGGLGGRDWVYINGELQDSSTHPGASQTVGRLQWFGRTIGNHHVGEGEAREVEILKGANMSYRAIAIEGLKFDSSLRGKGAQVHNDMCFSLAVKQRGWKLLYDPAVSVDHFPAQRFDEDQRGKFREVAFLNEVYNLTLVLLQYLSPHKRIIFLGWSHLIGTRRSFGILQLLRFLPSEKDVAWRKWKLSLEARNQALKTWSNLRKS